MKTRTKKSLSNEFTSRLCSDEWNRRINAQIESVRKERAVVRKRIITFASALVISATTLTAKLWDEENASARLYAMIEQAAASDIADPFFEQ